MTYLLTRGGLGVSISRHYEPPVRWLRDARFDLSSADRSSPTERFGTARRVASARGVASAHEVPLTEADVERIFDLLLNWAWDSMDAERRGDLHMKAPQVEATAGSRVSTASTLEDTTAQAKAMTQEKRQTRSSPIYKEEALSISPSSRDLQKDFALLKEAAERAIKAKQRGVMGKVSLGSSWNPELYELLIGTMPAGHRFELRGTEIWYMGDPQGFHEFATREFARGVEAYMYSVPVHCRGSTVAVLGRSSRKEPDESWQLGTGRYTVLETVGGLETDDEMADEMKRWLKGGRNVIIMRIWYNGVSGNAAVAKTETATLGLGPSCFVIAQGAEWTKPQAWRFGEAAQHQSWATSLEEQSGASPSCLEVGFLRTRKLQKPFQFFSKTSAMKWKRRSSC